MPCPSAIDLRKQISSNPLPVPRHPSSSMSHSLSSPHKFLLQAPPTTHSLSSPPLALDLSIEIPHKSPPIIFPSQRPIPSLPLRAPLSPAQHTCSSDRSPSMVKVFPVPVCPYAKMVQLKPSSTSSTMGATAWSYTSLCFEPVPNTWRRTNERW